MKKLTLPLLLIFCFPANAFSPIMAAPCESGDIDKEVQQMKVDFIKENGELTEEENEILTPFFENMVQDFDVRFGLYKCMESPQGQMVNDFRHGVWTWYNKFNQKTKEGNYVNGKKEGKWTEWIYSSDSFHSGSDLILMNYKNDMLDGKWTRLYSNRGTFENWEAEKEKIYLEGLLKQYKFEENQTKIDQVNAQLKALEMPKIIEEGVYINGKKEGTWTIWNSYGIYSEEKNYEDGVLIKKKLKNELPTDMGFQCSDVITEKILEYQRKSSCTLPKDIWVCKEGFTKSDDGKRCIRDSKVDNED